MDPSLILNEIYKDETVTYKCSEVTESTGFTPLMVIVMNVRKYPELFDYLKIYLKDNPNEIDKQNTKKWTALMLACRNSAGRSNNETVKLLLDAGADVNKQSDLGYTALILASMCSNTDSNNETVKLLLHSGANVNIQGKCGWTALMVACQHSYKESNNRTVKLLLDAGADVNLELDTGQAAVLLCSTEKTRKILYTYRYIREIERLRIQNTILMKENQFYRESLGLHPDGPLILELKKDFMEKAQQLKKI